MLLSLQRLHHCLLLLRCYTSEHTVFCNCFVHLFLGCDRCRIYIMLCIFKTCTSGNCRNCHRIITGDHFQINTLTFEICQRIRCLCTDHICNKQKSDRFQSLRKLRTLTHIYTMGKDQHTKTFLCKSATILHQLRVPFREKKLRCTHQISTCICKCSSAVLPVRRKRDHMIQLHILRYFKSCPECIGSGILILQHRKQISHDMLDLPDLLRIFLTMFLRVSV